MNMQNSKSATDDAQHALLERLVQRSARCAHGGVHYASAWLNMRAMHVAETSSR